MRGICDSTRIVESRQIGKDTYEVCATAIAVLDDTENELFVNLDSFVRKVNPRGLDTLLRPGWLPNGESIRHRISVEEAADEAREIFQRWSTKVRRTIPGSEAFAESLSDATKQSSPPVVPVPSV